MVIHGLKWMYEKRGARGFTIGQLTLIFISPSDNRYWQTMNHEAIHRTQFKECGGILKLWKIYKAERKKLMAKYDKITASRLTRFEQEAYTNAMKMNYLKTRESFAWRKY